MIGLPGGTELSSPYLLSNSNTDMKKETYAAGLILVAFFSGMVLTAATSGCDTPEAPTNVATETASDSPTL